MTGDVDKLWVEKYRPTKLEDVILDDTNKLILSKFIKEKEIPNLLFSGCQGIGKTTTARVLINALESEYTEFNCAEVGIDVVRTTISSFSKTKSFNGEKKIVFLDELDAASPDAQRGLRNTIEENAGYCRYIFTCNYLHRVIEPLQSRCQSLNLTPPIEPIVKYLVSILKREKIKADNTNLQKMVLLIKQYYPDIRKSINEVQKYTFDGILKIPDNTQTFEFSNKLVELILTKKVLQARKLIIENENLFRNDYVALMRQLFNNVCNNQYSLNENQKKLWLITIGEYLYRTSFVVDQEINFYCLMLAMSEIN